MIADFTPNKLIQFIYGEVSYLEKLEIEHAIGEDEVLKRSYLDLYNAYQSYPKVKFLPKQSTINNIMNYNSNVALNPA